jgi:putative acetyltransferase
MALVIAIEDPATEDIKALLQIHLNFCHDVTPAEHSFALDVEKLRMPGITLFAAREDGVLLGVGAIKDLGDGAAELKSMHTAQVARGKGVGGAMVKEILAHAKSGGFSRVYLETGSHPPYEPARRLYAGLGFEPSEPFGDYIPSEFNTFMSRDI